MYAIVKTGGKQYRVEAGRTLEVERLPVGEGDTIELGEVLMIAGDGNVTIGTPLIEGARVMAHVDSNGRAPKIIVFKYKSKVRYRKKTGHRQNFTRLTVEQILRPGEEAKVIQRKPAEVEDAIDTEEVAEAIVEAGAVAAAETATEPIAVAAAETEVRKPRARRAAPTGEKKKSAKPAAPKPRARRAAPAEEKKKSAKPAAPKPKPAKAAKPAAKAKSAKPAARAKIDDKPKAPRRRPSIGRKKETE